LQERNIPLGLPLIIYAVFATVVLVCCTISQARRQAEYMPISTETLKDLARKRDDLIVVDLRKAGYETVSGSLRVPREELKAFLQWVPEHSTLVLCGSEEVASCRDDIKGTLFRLGFQSVFVVDDGPTIVPVARRAPLSSCN
jgi:hypothetical protein